MIHYSLSATKASSSIDTDSIRKLRSSRSQKTLFNLAIALLCADVIFLGGIDKTESYIGCVVVAACLHYFLLASFIWMLIEGILQYIRFVKIFDTYIYKFTLKMGIIAWGEYHFMHPPLVLAISRSLNALRY